LPVGMTNFGASFKKARESKGITLDQIAKKTRISTRFLAAIEDEEFHLLPGGIFNRGFVRNFAETVGLDADQAVADYERLVSVHEPLDLPASATPPVKNDRRLYPIALGVLAIAIAIFYLVTREPARTVETPPPPTPTAPAAQPSPAPDPAVTTTPQQPATTPPPPTEPEPAPPTAANVQAATTQALTLDIEAREKTWIKIASDGNTVGTEILEPGMTRKFTAENSLYISIGNAAGLTLKVNDMPLKPLGKSGQVRSVTITPANLKDFIG
jgi:cytoskeleton protein RodZ